MTEFRIERFGKSRQDAPGGLAGADVRSVFQKDDEFVSAEPRDHIRGASCSS